MAASPEWGAALTGGLADIPEGGLSPKGGKSVVLFTYFIAIIKLLIGL